MEFMDVLNLFIMKKVFLYLLIIFFTYCNNKKENLIKSTDLIEIDFDSTPEFNGDTSIIDSINYIPLETNENILIQNLTKILFVSSKFYLFDYQTKTIYIFNKSGEFINKVHRVGRGPGEYIDIMDFDVDNNESLYLYDNYSSKVIILTKDLRYFKEYRLRSRFEEFAILDDKTLIVRNLYKNGRISSRIATYNIADKKSVSILDVNAYNDDFNIVRFSKFSFYESGNKILFNPRFTKTIYEINNKLDNYLNINGSYPSKDFIKKYSDNSQMMIMQDEYIIDIRNIYENSSTFVCTLQKQFIYNLLVSKYTQKSFLFNNIKDEVYFGNNSFYGVADGFFVSQFDYKNLNDNYFTEKVNECSLNIYEKEILLSADKNMNPILILIKFKQF